MPKILVGKTGWLAGTLLGLDVAREGKKVADLRFRLTLNHLKGLFHIVLHTFLQVFFSYALAVGAFFLLVFSTFLKFFICFFESN